MHHWMKPAPWKLSLWLCSGRLYIKLFAHVTANPVLFRKRVLLLQFRHWNNCSVISYLNYHVAFQINHCSSPEVELSINFTFSQQLAMHVMFGIFVSYLSPTLWPRSLAIVLKSSILAWLLFELLMTLLKAVNHKRYRSSWQYGN